MLQLLLCMERATATALPQLYVDFMKEFIVLMAYLTALVALSIDAMLPALGVMASDLHVERTNSIQLVVALLFAGMMVGQILYGPIADAIGRKRTLYIGIALFMLGSLISWHATSLPVMLLGRLIQGLGVASPRIVTMAVVRDKFHGRDMAYVMSMVMGVFIMVPAIAPTLGFAIIHSFGWRAIFLFYLIAAAVGTLWAMIRLKETLTPERRRPFSLKTIWSGVKEAATTRMTLGYTLCAGLTFGAMIGYLNSAQQIFEDLFQTGDRFALYFGLLALSIGAAFFSNSALVRRLGMRRITRAALILLVSNATLFFPYAYFGTPSLLFFMLFAAVSFFCLGLSIGNMGAMALEPMGHMAGLASAFMGSASTAISLLLGTIIGQLYDGTLVALAGGFFSLSIAALLIMQWTERGHRPAPIQHGQLGALTEDR